MISTKNLNLIRRVGALSIAAVTSWIYSNTFSSQALVFIIGSATFCFALIVVGPLVLRASGKLSGRLVVASIAIAVLLGVVAAAMWGAVSDTPILDAIAGLRDPTAWPGFALFFAATLTSGVFMPQADSWNER